MKAVSSPEASRSNKKRKVDDVGDADDLTLESIMGEIKDLKKSNERIEDLLKNLVKQAKDEDDDSEDEEKTVDGGDDDDDGEEEDEENSSEEEENLSPQWLAKFEELRKFKKRHGHMRIPKGKAGGTLGRWMIRQRSEKKMGRMTFNASKKAKLDSIDFDWAPQVNTPTKKRWNVDDTLLF